MEISSYLNILFFLCRKRIPTIVHFSTMGCMRCFSRVKPFHVKIILLDKQELIQEIRSDTTGLDLLNSIFKYLNLAETVYFGLRYQDHSNQTVCDSTIQIIHSLQSMMSAILKMSFFSFQHWLDAGKRVCSQIQGLTPVTLYLGVKFYAADPCKLMEEITRYQFFLQVKLDILQGRLPVSPELAIDLAALALQCK